MGNPSTATPNAATAAVNDAVRITMDAARRTTDTTQAAVAFGRRSLEQSSQINRDLFALWTATAQASFQTAFDVQNAALASSQSLFDASFTLTKDAARRWADVARQAQSTTLTAYQTTAHALEQALNN